MGCYCPCSHWRGNHFLNPLPHLVQILSARLKSSDLVETRRHMKIRHQVILLLEPCVSWISCSRVSPLTSSFSSHTRLGYHLSTPSLQTCLHLISYFSGKDVLPGNQVNPFLLYPHPTLQLSHVSSSCLFSTGQPTASLTAFKPVQVQVSSIFTFLKRTKSPKYFSSYPPPSVPSTLTFLNKYNC